MAKKAQWLIVKKGCSAKRYAQTFGVYVKWARELRLAHCMFKVCFAGSLTAHNNLQRSILHFINSLVEIGIFGKYLNNIIIY